MTKSRTVFLVVAGIIAGMFICAGMITTGLILRNSEYAVPRVAPVIQVISAPTSTSTATAEPEMVVTEEVKTPTFVPAQGGIQVGALVEIAGTEGEGLRFRDDPGLDGRILFLAVENEVFEVIDGPVSKDGYIWWYLVNPYNPGKSGWSVANFIQLVTAP